MKFSRNYYKILLKLSFWMFGFSNIWKLFDFWLKMDMCKYFFSQFLEKLA